MRSMLAFFTMLSLWSAASADITDCQNLYVGRIWVENGSGGLHAAVFLNDPTNASGSFWVFFNSWNVDDKKAALALLTTAKISQHRVNIATTNTGECGIQSGWTTAKDVFLANSP